MEEVDELELLVERVAGLDVGKAQLVACVRCGCVNTGCSGW